MLAISAGRDPHQPGHLAPVAKLAHIILDYSVLLGAEAAKDTHIHLCLSSRFLLYQSIFAFEKSVGNGGLKTDTTVPGMGAGMATCPTRAFQAAALSGVTNHSLVLWCQPRSRALVPTP